MKELKVLVIGLGSMGKRRIRNCIALGIEHISGFDTNVSRTSEAKEKYGIKTFNDFSQCAAEHFDAFIISVPPDVHHVYMKEALSRNIPAFIEASVVDDGLAEINKKAKEQKLLLAPSCTLWFHPAIKLIRGLLDNKELGKISNILYHSGQYLPDWHTYEHVKDFYVSNKETGGAREIVPFELTWLTMVLGFPQRVTGIHKKTIDIEGAETIDDTYNLLLDYTGFILNLSVDVVSRAGTRRLVINGDKRQLYWNWDDQAIQLYDPSSQSWQTLNYSAGGSEAGYNKNITEEMYIDEMAAFFNAVKGNSVYPNTLDKDIAVLNVLYKAEEANRQLVTI